MRLNRVGALAVALIAVGWCAAGGFAGADPTSPTPTPTPTSSPGSTPAAAPKTTIDKDGTYAVGTDIVPGVYSSAGPVENATCYWKRINGDTIVDNAMTKKPQIVEIESTDTAFKTDHCQPWKLTTCPPDCPPSPSPLPPGLLPALGGVLGAQPAGPTPTGTP